MSPSGSDAIGADDATAHPGARCRPERRLERAIGVERIPASAVGQPQGIEPDEAAIESDGRYLTGRLAARERRVPDWVGTYDLPGPSPGPLARAGISVCPGSWAAGRGGGGQPPECRPGVRQRYGEALAGAIAQRRRGRAALRGARGYLPNGPDEPTPMSRGVPARLLAAPPAVATVRP